MLSHGPYDIIESVKILIVIKDILGDKLMTDKEKSIYSDIIHLLTDNTTVHENLEQCLESPKGVILFLTLTVLMSVVWMKMITNTISFGLLLWMNY